MIAAAGRAPAPTASTRTSAARAATIGTRKLRRALAHVARRQAMTGPIPDSSTSRSASGTVYLLNHGGPDGRLRPGHRLRDQREERAPEDDEGQADQHDVVAQERRLARQQRVEAVLGAQHGAARDDQVDRADDHQRDQRDERDAERRGAERVDRVEDPRAHQERAQDRQRPGGQHQRRRSRSSASRASPAPSPSAGTRCRSATAAARRSRPGPRPSSRPSPARSTTSGRRAGSRPRGRTTRPARSAASRVIHSASTRRTISAPIANANGTAHSVYPEYSMGGWIIMLGWRSSGLRPGALGRGRRHRPERRRR